MLTETIRGDLTDAMRRRDEFKTTVLRGVIAAFVNELVATGKKPDGRLGDEEAQTVLRRLVKQRKDSAEQFRAGKREDLAETEEKELEVLQGYLPAMMPEEDVRKIAEAKKTELGITDKSKAGLLMSVLMKDLRGKADGTVVKKVVDTLLS